MERRLAMLLVTDVKLICNNVMNAVCDRVCKGKLLSRRDNGMFIITCKLLNGLYAQSLDQAFFPRGFIYWWCYNLQQNPQNKQFNINPTAAQFS